MKLFVKIWLDKFVYAMIGVCIFNVFYTIWKMIVDHVFPLTIGYILTVICFVTVICVIVALIEFVKTRRNCM